MNDYFNHVTCFEVIYYFIYKVQTYPQSITQIVMFQKIIFIGFLVLNIVDCRRIPRDASIVFDDDIDYMGRSDGVNFLTKQCFMNFWRQTKHLQGKMLKPTSIKSTDRFEN